MTKAFRSILIAVLVSACLFAVVLAGCSSDENPDEILDDSDEEAHDETYTVTFDLNYEGAPESSSVTVAWGETVSVPSDPTGDGDSVFSGWYGDSACTIPFDFSSPITADVTAYAGWIVRLEGHYLITYMWNYEGAEVYAVSQWEQGVPLNDLAIPERSGYSFRGWYKEAECSTRQFVGVLLSGDLTLYALWYEGFVFEAEYTDLMDENHPSVMRGFQGYSLNGDPVHRYSGASNGYYIGDMDADECYIYFEIESDEAVDDAELHLTLAMDYGWGITTGVVSFTDKEYTIYVNDEAISYETFSFDVSNLTGSTITDFVDVYINDVPLVEGANRIDLVVSNNTHGEGGTQEAKAPLVDCMTIYSPTNLTWEPIEDNLRYGV